MRKSIVLIIISLLSTLYSFGQSKDLAYSHKWSLAFGLTQPLLLDGFNVAVNYTTNRWVFEYSHGMFLNYKGPALKAPYNDQLISLKSPISTGPGAGYRFFANAIVAMDIRAEAKIHLYQAELTPSLSISYTNFDLGGGMYWQIRPFGKKDNVLKGITLEPSIRYWRQIASSLEKDFTYASQDGQVIEHNPYPLNLFGNLSIGYTFR